MYRDHDGRNPRDLGFRLALILVAVGAFTIYSRSTSSAAHAPLVIYSDGLDPSWADWSWNTTINWQDTTDPHSGKYDVAFTFYNPWDGLSVHSDDPIDTTPYDLVQFWINGGEKGGQQLWLYVEYPGGGSSPPVDLAPYIAGHSIAANTWSEVEVPLSVLGAQNTQIDRLDFFNDTGDTQPTMYLDDLSLFDDGKPPPPPKDISTTVTVNATAGRHPISPYIYGVAAAGSTFLKQNNLTLERWGGNPTSRYNWRLGAAMNTASDWYFENTNYGNSCHTPGCAADEMVAGDRSVGAASLVTVPTLGWVAKNADLNTCGFAVSKYGPQQQTDPYRPNCGNGMTTGSKPIIGNNPADTSVRSTPADIKAWIRHLIAKFGTAAHGGVRFYAMDNEPELWYSTHRDVAPNPLTYDGLYKEFETYATAVKSVDPSAMIDGPVPWGWSAYFDSSYDYVHQTESDRLAHGNLPIIPWFLQTVRKHDQTAHRRTLDVLDIHYYPQGSNVFSEADDPGTDALRLRETRALWDPTYTDESWIDAQVDLIPRMKAWINQYYPGTKLGISEWNWGGESNMSGALAIADVLGLYGREGIYLASYWTYPNQGSPAATAFDMYRNYDGHDSAFGNESVQTVSSAPNDLMAFGSLRTKDHRLLVMLVNQEPSDRVDVKLTLKNVRIGGSATVHEYGPNSTTIQHMNDIKLSPSMSVRVPPYSIELLVAPTG